VATEAEDAGASEKREMGANPGDTSVVA